MTHIDEQKLTNRGMNSTLVVLPFLERTGNDIETLHLLNDFISYKNYLT